MSEENPFGKLLADVAEASAKSNCVNPGDYQIDGLWYCGKCRTPKQIRRMLNGEPFEPFCLCECEQQRRKDEDRERRARYRAIEIEETRRRAFALGQLRDCTFEKDIPENDRVSKVAHRYAEHFPLMLENNKGIMFYGPVGTGKSFYAACIANAVIDAGFSVYVTSFPHLAKSLTTLSADKEDILERLAEYDLLVLDDYGTERDTSYMREIEHTVLDTRMSAGKPMIITTNYTKSDFEGGENTDHTRMISRILSVCVPVQVDGNDRRRKQAKADYGKVKDLLGL